MKKLLLPLVFLSCSLFAHADYTAADKTINVVIPQSNPSGLANMFLMMQNYAEKKKISLVPIYKPGASGKIGLDYAEKTSNDGNTLLLATTSDILQNNASSKFDPVTNISEVRLVLVASKKSNIKHINDIVKAPADKFNWVYISTPQLALINSIADHYNMEKSKMQLVAYSPARGVPPQVSLISGDADIGYVMYSAAKQFIETDQLTVVELDLSLKKKLDAKVNAVSLFLPKNTNADANKFWEGFVGDFLKDEDTKKKFEAMDNHALPVGKVHLKKVLDSWVN